MSLSPASRPACCPPHSSAVLLAAAVLLLGLSSGCAEKKKPAPPVKPTVAAVLAAPKAEEEKPLPPPAPAEPAPQAPAVEPLAKTAPPDEKDRSCSYFYFLWGQHAELETKYEAALEAYEKALICDPAANFITKKLFQLLLNMNRSKEAAAKIEEHLVQHPDDTESRMLLAKVLIRDGRLDEAAEQCRQAYALNPKDTMPLLLLSELHLLANQDDLAKNALNNVLAVDRSSAPAHLLLARLLAAEKNFAKALEHYQQAAELNPAENLRLELAGLLARQKKYSKAAKIYQELLAADELNEEARIGLIHVHLLQGRKKKAMAELRRLKELAGDVERADLTVIKLCIQWEEFGKAISLLQDLLKTEELSEARYLLAALLFQEKRHKEALKTLEKLGPGAKEHEDGLLLRARTLQELKRPEKAVKLLEDALARPKPPGPDLYLALAGLRQATEQDESAEKIYQQGVQAHPRDERLLYEYGLFLDLSGKKKKALTVMRQLLKVSPDHVGALNYVGYAWAESKVNLNKAFLYLTRAKELRPEEGCVYDSLGWVYYRQGNLGEALKTLEEAARLVPDDPTVFDHLGEVHLTAGRKEEAVQAWRRALELHRAKTDQGGRRMQAREEAERRRIEEKIAALKEKP
ncbi:tetratricopeptide repeat protein [Candidatus Electronema sp. JC]|uniref:tetratricopeptide repeat protein n=1 Tax=Candidatus Electronema sp. JC TaxID=3401570 RepID=UPI003B42C0FB